MYHLLLATKWVAKKMKSDLFVKKNHFLFSDWVKMCILVIFPKMDQKLTIRSNNNFLLDQKIKNYLFVKKITFDFLPEWQKKTILPDNEFLGPTQKVFGIFHDCVQGWKILKLVFLPIWGPLSCCYSLFLRTRPFIQIHIDTLCPVSYRALYMGKEENLFAFCFAQNFLVIITLFNSFLKARIKSCCFF